MGLNPATSDDFLFEIELEDMCEEDPSTWEELANERWLESTWPAEETRDSTSGELLDPKKVHEGCQEELGFMSQMGVWDNVTREKARNDPEGKIVGTRWVFVKKGEKIRCRLVAQEFAGSDKREDLYAGTPPLSATRYLLSDSVSREASGNIKKGGASLRSVTPGRRRSSRKGNGGGHKKNDPPWVLHP